MWFVFFVLFCVVLVRGVDLPSITTPISEILYEWVTLDYNWRSAEQRQQYIDNGQFLVENNTIAGIKVWDSEIYVTVPRWRSGVPSTLNKVINVGGRAVLDPYPSWEMQQIGNLDALQYIQSMEIDTRGWMWILDVARIDLMGYGQPKLLIWDIPRNCTIRKFTFPDSVLSYTSSFANDLVVDETNGFAFISDTSGTGGLVVYDFNTNTARRFGNDPSLLGNSSNKMPILGRFYKVGQPTDGIGLSHDTETVYYCSLSRLLLYSVPSAVLRDFNLTDAEIGKHVELEGTKGYTDGMTYSEKGFLYYGDLSVTSVKVWDTNNSPLSSALVLVQDSTSLQWADTFAWDDIEGSLYFVTNKLQKFLFGEMQFDGSDGFNFRIWRVKVNDRSYLTKKPVPLNLPCQ